MKIILKVCGYNNKKNGCHIKQIFISIFLFCSLFFKIKINLVLLESFIIILEYS